MADWERRVDAMMMLLSRRGLMGGDQLRRAIEALTPVQYDTMTYYEKWASALERLMIERGIITAEELERKMREDS